MFVAVKNVMFPLYRLFVGV